ncbi:hypothetical protein F8388_004550 [Cannabis sativa]|uniref:Uncharacterized protein n=1 Tax=Cannabis sativa TaxID=3483 RepID=A0A7J6DKM0_CANSA|nr:hypothetical protein G4B88_023086 [Cannabis sativa]KAF4384317.1 hypothetical protein F8388_004550 [Cannabis sativa]
MAKNRNKKKRDSSAMEVTEDLVSDVPQAMDTSETGARNVATGAPNMKVKKGRPMKRSKNVRKMKSIAKAISKSEKTVEKVLKHDDKKSRTQSAKLLYE